MLRRANTSMRSLGQLTKKVRHPSRNNQPLKNYHSSSFVGCISLRRSIFNYGINTSSLVFANYDYEERSFSTSSSPFIKSNELHPPLHSSSLHLHSLDKCHRHSIPIVRSPYIDNPKNYSSFRASDHSKYDNGVSFLDSRTEDLIYRYETSEADKLTLLREAQELIHSWGLHIGREGNKLLQGERVDNRDRFAKDFKNINHGLSQCVSIFDNLFKHHHGQSQNSEDVVQTKVILTSLYDHILSLKVKYMPPPTTTSMAATTANNDKQSNEEDDHTSIQSTLVFFYKYMSYFANTALFHRMLNQCSYYQLSLEAEELLLQMTRLASSSLQTEINSSLSSSNVTYECKPNTLTFNHVLKAQRMPHRAQAILEQMIKLSTAESNNVNSDNGVVGNHDEIKPDSYSFHTVMNAFIQAPNDISIDGKRAKHVQEILDMLLETTNVEPDIVTYNTLLNAYAMDKEYDKMLEIFQELSTGIPTNSLRSMKRKPDSEFEYTNSDVGSSEIIYPDEISYRTMIKAFVSDPVYSYNRKTRFKSPKEFRDFLLSALYKQHKSQEGLEQKIYVPNVLNDLIKEYNTSGKSELAESCLSLQSEFGPEFQSFVDIRCYNSMINFYSKKNEPDKAYSILQKLEQQASTSPDEFVFPNSFSFNSVISSYAALGNTFGAKKVLQQMKQKQPDESIIPDTVTYNVVLSSYAKALQNILNAFRRNKRNRGLGKTSRKNDDDTKTKCISIIKQSINLLKEMEDTLDNEGVGGYAPPDVISYTTILSCLSNIMTLFSPPTSRVEEETRHSIYQTMESIIKKMESLEDENYYGDGQYSQFRMDNTAYNVLLKGYASLCQHNSRKGKRNDRDNENDKFKFVYQVLSKMNQRSNTRPDNVTYNTILLHLSNHSTNRSNDKDALFFLQQMEQAPTEIYYDTKTGTTSTTPDVIEGNDSIIPVPFLRKPDAGSYNTILNFYANNERGVDALQLLRSMNEKEMNTHRNTNSSETLIPNSRSFNIVLNSFAKVGDYETCESILQLMKDYEENVNNKYTSSPHIQIVDKMSYSSMLKALSVRDLNGAQYNKSNQEENNETKSSGLEKAKDTLNEMLEQNVYPDTVCFNIVFYHVCRLPCGAHSKTSEIKQLLEFMTKSYIQQFGKNISGDTRKNPRLSPYKPDAITLNSIINACSHTNSEEEKKEALFMAMKMFEIVMNNDRRKSREKTQHQNFKFNGTDTFLSYNNNDGNYSSDGKVPLLFSNISPRMFPYQSMIKVFMNSNPSADFEDAEKAKHSKKIVEWMKEVFQQAHIHGKVNQYLLKDFKLAFTSFEKHDKNCEQELLKYLKRFGYY